MLIGNYMIDFAPTNKPFASGSQGSLFSGKNISTEEQIAVKVIDMTNRKKQNAFETESAVKQKIGSSLQNNVELLDFYQFGNYGYIIMKRYECDLFTFAFGEHEYLLEEKVIKPIFKKICVGVKKLHKKRIAHLDLKPENILFNPTSKEPYICDYGNAFIVPSIYKRNKSQLIEISNLGFRGTENYACPEMSTSPNCYDPYKADIFSIGAILYVLLCGDNLDRDEQGFVSLDLVREEGASDKSIDLLSSLLHPDPKKRLTIDQILEHPFCSEGATTALKRKICKSKKIFCSF